MPDAILTWSQWLEARSALGLVRLSKELEAAPWRPSDADSRAAWRLYVELRTRIATQPLHYRSGDEETALQSLYQLFGTTRTIIEDEGPECRHLATIAIQVLNTHVRPLTAKWHKKSIEGRLLNDDDRREFRRDLKGLRKVMAVLCRVLGSIAEGDDFREPDACEVGSGKSEGQGAGVLGASISFDHILLEGSVARRDDLFQVESAEIRARRGALDTAARGGRETPGADQGPIEDLVGLACSGGGIRSATFCLGVVQSLARLGILPRIDYLSTVSGGGYFGSFLSSYLNDPERDKVGLEGGKLPFEEPGHAESTPLRALRNNSKYLLKGGLLGQARMAGLLLFGILVNLLTVLPFLLGALALTKALERFGVDPAGFHTFIGVVLTCLGVVLTGMVVGLPFVYRAWADRPSWIARYERYGIYIGLGLVAVWALGWLLPWVYAGLREVLGSPEAVLVLFAALPFGGAAFALSSASGIRRLLIALVGISGPLLLLMAYLTLDEMIASGWPEAFCLLAIAGIVLFWLWRINVNQISPHRYYRNRLAETYLIGREQSDRAQTPPQQLLSELRSRNPAAPYHLINAAVNLPSSKRVDLRGRNSDFFLFSQHFCGSPLLGYCRTEDLEKKDPHLDLGTAMSISGAAASSFMGTVTIKGLSFWLALLNIRLAYWLPNPNRLADVPDKAAGHPFSLWRELLGRMDENGKFLNLSDGGHIENLGIYELLRRRCKLIIAIDGEADPEMDFPSLMQLIRYAQIDFGIRIRIDLTDLVKNPAGYSKAHFVLGTIDYGDDQRGYLLYIKSSLTGNERDYILDYRRAHPSFPHESTADQFFSEAQFEAYRALGEHIGDDLMQPELIGDKRDVTLEEWLGALVCNLLEEH